MELELRPSGARGNRSVYPATTTALWSMPETMHWEASEEVEIVAAPPNILFSFALGCRNQWDQMKE